MSKTAPILEPNAKLAAVRRQARAETRRVRKLIADEHEARYRETKLGRPGPTAETRRKLARHPTEDLYDRGIIDDGHVRALSAIEEAFRLITHGARLRLSSPVRVDGSGVADWMTDRDVEWVSTYADWVDALAAEGTLACFRICIDVGVDGMSLSAISRQRGMNKNTIKKRLVEGLDIYLKVRSRRRNRKS